MPHHISAPNKPVRDNRVAQSTRKADKIGHRIYGMPAPEIVEPPTSSEERQQIFDAAIDAATDGGSKERIELLRQYNMLMCAWMRSAVPSPSEWIIHHTKHGDN